MGSGNEVSHQLRHNLDRIQERIAKACTLARRPTSEVTLIAITKYVDAGLCRLVHEAGVQHLGESRPQMLWEKAPTLPSASWHLVGHLQRNKVTRTLPMVQLIHSVDSVRLLQSIEEEATKLNCVKDVLLELHMTEEETKSGFTANEWPQLPEVVQSLQHVRVKGLMCMAPLDGGLDLARKTFHHLKELRDQWQNRFREPHQLRELSMGMTSDFEMAILEGATMIRIGSALFEGII